MRCRVYGAAIALAAFVVVPGVSAAQGEPETSRAVAGGGISVAGWAGKIDANEERSGQKLENAKLSKGGEAVHVTTGPAVTY